MDSSTASGSSRRKNLRSSAPVRPITEIDSDSDVQELEQSPKPRARPAKRAKKSENPESPVIVDEVRAPIPQSTAVLSGADPFALMSHQFSDLRKQYKDENARARKEQRNGGQPVFDSLRDYQADSRAGFIPGQAASTSAQSSSRNGLPNKLGDIFRPPVEIMTYGTFDEVQIKARRKIQWLLVNIHNYSEFACQRFVRDCLRHEAVKEIIQENFVFWSVNHDSKEGLRYSTHYKVEAFPHLAVIDPRTGAKVMTYGEMNVLEFCNTVSEFLAEKPSFDPTALQAAQTTSPPILQIERSDSNNSNSSVQIIDQEEDDMRRAMELSKQEEKIRKERSERPDIEDIEDVIVGFDDDEEEEPVIDKIKSPNNHPNKELLDPPSAPREDHSWKEFLGNAEDPEIGLKIRLPTGAALDLALPNSSQLRAVLRFIEMRGFPPKDFDVLTSYPKRSLTALDASILLSDAGFTSRDMLIVQQRD